MRNRLSELLPERTLSQEVDIVIEPSLASHALELVARIHFANKKLLIVCDELTHKALASKLVNELKSLSPSLITLEGKPVADEATIKEIRSKEYEALIAVGSGTISDLCKYASFLDNKPYAVFPTAASMNGYLSANASITIKSHKKTLPAHLPSAIFCDMGVIANAPKRLTLSGLGDSLCRPTAQGDWLLSHLLFDTPYSVAPFDWLKPYETELFAHSDKLASGDINVVEFLMRTLLVSGLGMVMAGGSYPASQGEHLIAHTMEMKHGAKSQSNFHGEEIGVTTLTMAKIQEELLSRKLHLTKRRRREAAITAYFGSELAASVIEASWEKHHLYDRYNEVNAKLESRDSEIRDALRAVTLPESCLREVLANAGAPTSPQALGWNDREYELAVSHARFIRDRFTFLDLL